MTDAIGRALLVLGIAGLAGACGGSPASVACESPCDGMCESGRCLTTLASNLSTAGALAVDETNVYFAFGGFVTGSTAGVLEIPKTGGNVATIASQVEEPSALALQGSSLYWTTRGTHASPGEGGTLRTSPREPTMPATTLASGLALPTGVAVDGSSVYWTEANPGRVSRIPLAGGTPTVLASSLDFPGSIAVDATNVYWVEGGTSGKPSPAGDTKLMMMPLAGGTPTTLATAGMLTSGGALTIDAHSVYWTFSVYMIVNSKSVCTLGKVLSVPLDGGAATTLASGQNGPHAIAVDATAVYWINEGSEDDGAVMKLPLAGGAPVALATGRTGASGIAVDATSVYWTEAGRVMKTSKE